ncbi:hypothetical protein SUGI_0201880 [Cryptomeria japonica]|nr:hypothetical protein SUGI_0201880 [Cryptomeria japonica]
MWSLTKRWKVVRSITHSGYMKMVDGETNVGTNNRMIEEETLGCRGTSDNQNILAHTGDKIPTGTLKAIMDGARVGISQGGD